MSEYEKYFVRSGSCPEMRFKCEPADAVKPVVCIDDTVIPDSFFGCVEWIMKDLSTEGLISHDTDELHMFIGGNVDDHENLNAEIDFQIENDHLTLTETCCVFVPKGCAHNIISVKNCTKPLYHCIMQIHASSYAAVPAEASAAVGTYANHAVYRYEPTDGVIPDAPEGFLTFMLWLDSRKLAGAPYVEAVWFHTTNDTGPQNHIHENLDEFIAFIGGDPEKPEELNGDISLFIGGETIHTTKSTLIYIPRQVSHSPLLVHELEKDCLHFSGCNGGDYSKDPIKKD